MLADWRTQYSRAAETVRRRIKDFKCGNGAARVGTSGQQDSSIWQKRCGMSGARGEHGAADECPGVRTGVIEFRRVGCAASCGGDAAGDQYPAVLQRSSSVAAA